MTIYVYYMRVWGKPICPNDGTPIESQSLEQMVNRVMAMPEKTKIQVLAPVVVQKKGEHKKVFEKIQKDGYVRVRVDGEMHEVTEEFNLEKNKKHNIEIVVDRIVVSDKSRSRLFDSIEAALRLAEGYAIVDVIGGGRNISSANTIHVRFVDLRWAN